MILEPRLRNSTQPLMWGGGAVLILLVAYAGWVSAEWGMVVLALAWPILLLGWLSGSMAPKGGPFEALFLPLRIQGLDLAWGQSSGGSKGGPLAIGGGTLVVVVCAIWEYSVAAGEKGQVDRCAVAAACGCIWFGLGYLDSKYLHGPFLWRQALRGHAVNWVAKWFMEWRRAARESAGNAAARKFDLVDAETQLYPLATLGTRAQPDMPPVREALTILVVGKYLGIRSGVLFEIQQTSYMQARSAAPAACAGAVVSEPAGMAEREVHYTDMASINYERTSRTQAGKGGKASGELLIEISGAQPLAYPTEDGSATAAIEEIRRRTRAVKEGRAGREKREPAPRSMPEVKPETAQVASPDIEIEMEVGLEEKECPQCAEMVKARARMCRYCRYEFPS